MSTVMNLMNKNPKAILHDASICDAAERMQRLQISSLLVERDSEFVGIVTDTDIVRKAVGKRLDQNQEQISSVMSNPVISLDQSRSPEDAFDLMGERRVRHLAVTDRGKIVGILSVRDLLLYFKKQSEPKMGID
jgi:CBS domain-containing protein